jgi:hypothetical protein
MNLPINKDYGYEVYISYQLKYKKGVERHGVYSARGH